jgi:hypothetical protein
MCTLTLVPLNTAEGRALRLGFNRDESRRRAEARPPRPLTFGKRNILMPIDPPSGGTWIAASDAGALLALMNITPAAGVAAVSHSRGLLIPSLLHLESPAEMIEAAASVDARDFAPFRLVIATLDQAAVFEHHGNGIRRQFVTPLDAPRIYTGSGLGDARVHAPRTELFRQMQICSPGTQDAFHRHSWPDRPHISVCMARSDARTVSYTAVQLTRGRIDMVYFSDAPDLPVTPVSRSLPVEAMEPQWT